ncbi:hypothetical protein ACOZ38_44190 [Sphaerisporangium viridialbum]|uniref:hypothetical protein n=1 Tax=Sphaerisporangium viridialbum TaxID=46189 RepID=UPI003C70B53C
MAAPTEVNRSAPVPAHSEIDVDAPRTDRRGHNGPRRRVMKVSAATGGVDMPSLRLLS